MTDPHYKEMLEQHLIMNRQHWEKLKQFGATEKSMHRLDFSYDAPSREAADALAAFIYKQTDYDVRVESDGSFLHRKWRVEGTTKETTISVEILDKWILWMVLAGKEQSCDFDGWGTSV